MNATLIAIAAYVAAQLGIGWYISRRIKTEEDYLVAGRSLGYGVATFTIFATWFGAETCISAAGQIYTQGLSGGSADPFGYALCLFAMGLFLAVPLWKRRLTTLADLFRLRYSENVERLAVLLMAPTSILWAAAQIRAFGQVLTASSGLAVDLTITLAAAVVILYTMYGGLLADAWTDVIQGVALMTGLIVLFIVFINDVGFGGFAAIEGARLNPFGGSDADVIGIIEAWAIPVCGSLMAAELVARIIASRSPQVARRSSLMAGGIYLLIGLIPVSIGLLGAPLLPNLGDPEHLLPMIAQRYLPGILYALFAGALVSAILSTVDSALLVASSLVSHNLIIPLRPDMPERTKVRIARSGVALFGLLAYVLAIYADKVYDLVKEASSFGSAGIFVVVLFALFSKFGGWKSAAASLVTGVLVWILGAYILVLPYPYLVSLGASFAAYVGVGIGERRGGGTGRRE